MFSSYVAMQRKGFEARESYPSRDRNIFTRYNYCHNQENSGIVCIYCNVQVQLMQTDLCTISYHKRIRRFPSEFRSQLDLVDKPLL